LIPRTLARALLLLLVPCTISFAAPPKVTLEAEGAADYAILGPGQWFDLLVRIEPQGSPIAPEGLEVDLATTLKGMDVGQPILPAASSKGGYASPFLVRIPVKAPAGKYPVTVRVQGKRTDGTAVDVTAKITLEPDANARGHLTGKAKLKKPAVSGEANAIVVDLDILPPYHVYGELGKGGVPMFGLLLPGRKTGPKTWWTGGKKTMPPGKSYEHGLSFEIPFTPTVAGPIKARVLINWQACTDQFCEANEIAYLPIEFEVEPGKAAPDAAPVNGDSTSGAISTGTTTGDDLGQATLWKIIVAAIGAGLFALAMPCTYPLIPITISFFTKQAEARSGNVTGLALAYGGGIVAIFVMIGLFVGPAIVEFATFWWVNAIFAALFLLFGLSLVGLFEIRLPSSFNNLAARASGSGGYLSVFAMGATLVITSFTCTAPFVGSLLVFAGKGGSLATVALAMGVFGLTMAIPFVFLSLSPKSMQKLPRSGEWMKHLKVTLGIVELGLVLKFVSNVDLARGWFIIGREHFLLMWGLSFVAAGLYLFGAFSLFRDRPGKGRMIVGSLLLAVAVYLFSGLGGARLGQNLEAFLPVLPKEQRSGDAPDYSDGFLAVVREDYDEGIRVAIEKNAPVFLHFTGFQ